MWVQLNFWVHSWPVFYAIMNGIGHIFLTKAGLTQAYSDGQGLSIATQNGLSDASYDAYCWVMGLQLSVPFISWAFISKSGYAITQMATSITQGLEGFASKIGSETADGNISFDTQSFHNRSMGSYQMTQQQLGANHNFARVVNDGSLTKTYGDEGAISATANMSNMATNMASNFNAAATASKSYQQSAQLAYQNTKAFAERVATGKADMRNFSEQEASDIRKASEKFLRADSNLSKNHNISEQTRFDMMMRGHIGAKWDGGLAGKAVQGISGFSGEIGVNASAGLSSDAANQHQISNAQSSTEGQQFSQSGSEVLQFAKQYSNQFSDNKSRELAGNINHSHMEAQNWSKVQSFAETKGITATTNETDNVLQYVANQQFGGDKDAAMHWANHNRDAFQNVSADYAANQSQSLKSWVKEADHVLSNKEIAQHLDKSHLPELKSYKNELSEEDLRIGQDQPNKSDNKPVAIALESNSASLHSASQDEGFDKRGLNTAENLSGLSKKQQRFDHYSIIAFDHSSSERSDDPLHSSFNSFNSNAGAINHKEELPSFQQGQKFDEQMLVSPMKSDLKGHNLSLPALRSAYHDEGFDKRRLNTTENLSGNSEKQQRFDHPSITAFDDLSSERSDDPLHSSFNSFNSNAGDINHKEELPSLQLGPQLDEQMLASPMKSDLKSHNLSLPAEKSLFISENNHFESDLSSQAEQLHNANLNNDFNVQKELTRPEAYSGEEFVMRSGQQSDWQKQEQQENSRFRDNPNQILSDLPSNHDIKSHQTSDVVSNNENASTNLIKGDYQSNAPAQQVNQNNVNVSNAAEEEQIFGNVQQRVNARLTNNEKQLADIQEKLENQRQALENQHDKKDNKSNLRNALSKSRKDIKRAFSK